MSVTIPASIPATSDHRQPLGVEQQHRAPARMPVEEDLLAGDWVHVAVERTRHPRRPSRFGPSDPDGPCERPDRPGGAADHHPGAPGAVRLPRCRGPAGDRRSDRCSSVPFAGRRMHGVVLELAASIRGRRGAARRAARGPRRRAPGRSGRARRVDRARVLLDPGSRAGPDARSGRDRGRRATRGARGRADRRRAGGALRRRARSGSPTASGRCSPISPAAGRRSPPSSARAALRRLEARGLVAIAARAHRPPPRAPRGLHDSRRRRPPLTADQRRRSEPILAALERRGRRGQEPGFLLHGVTGSGKTEVYLQAVERTLRRGRARSCSCRRSRSRRRRWPGSRPGSARSIAVMHSGLLRGVAPRRVAAAAPRRGAGVRRAALGGVRAAGGHRADRRRRGARELLQERGRSRATTPARVAARRAAEHGAVLIAGSATPRPGERSTSSRGSRLPRRVDGGALPRGGDPRHARQHHPLHPETRMALADLRHAGGKGILLLNRRGWSNFLSCRACGRVWMCPNCEVALVLHRSRRRSSPATTAAIASGCPSGARRAPRWRSPATAPGPSGWSASSPARSGRRASRSCASTPTPAAPTPGAATLERVRRRAGRAAVGTQMVAKGHDFPDVGLGIVLDADATLRFPDFRAEERTFALVTQLAGRAGPRSGGGRVLVQTTRAGGALDLRSPPRHDADGFLADELARRRLLRYPPFSIADPDRLLGAERARTPRRDRRRAADAGPGRGRDGARTGAAVPPARAPALSDAVKAAEREAAIDRGRRRGRATRARAASRARGEHQRRRRPAVDRLPAHDFLDFTGDVRDRARRSRSRARVTRTTLDPELAARRAAALSHVRKFGDPVLRTRARAGRARSTMRCATRSPAWAS